MKSALKPENYRTQGRKTQVPISTKLLISFASVLAMVIGLSYSSLTAISGLGATLDNAVNANARKLQLVDEIQTGFQEMRADSTKVEISLVNMLIVRLNAPGEGVVEGTCSGCHTTETVFKQRQQLDRSVCDRPAKED